MHHGRDGVRSGEHRVLEGWIVGPPGTEGVERIQHHASLVDRVDDPTLTPVWVWLFRVPGAAGHHDLRVVRPAAAGPDLQGGRLGDDRRIGREAALDERHAPRSGRLLVGVRRDDEVAREPDRGEGLRGDDHRRDAALHVAGAPPVQQPVAHLRG